MERVMGIEPTLAAWEAAVLPLNYTRGLGRFYGSLLALRKSALAQVYFPSKSYRTPNR